MDTASVTHWPLLSLLIWLPILGGVLSLIVGDRRPDAARWTSLIFALITLVLTVPLFRRLGFKGSSRRAPLTSKAYSI